MQANWDQEKVFEGVEQFPNQWAGMQRAAKTPYLFKIS
jgi:hypothetical protein